MATAAAKCPPRKEPRATTPAITSSPTNPKAATAYAIAKPDFERMYEPAPEDPEKQ